MTAPHDDAETRREFKSVVTMTPAALRRWLDGDDSRSVGMAPGGERITAPDQTESVGHHMGERILELLATKPADVTSDDLADMRKVIGYVHRHSAQRPSGEIEHSRWRKSLMNWGHDPLK